MNRRKRSSSFGVASQLLTAIPRRLITITAGVSGVGFAFGVLVGALGYRAIRSRKTQRETIETNHQAQYEAWTKAKLHAPATELELPGRGEMNKDELIDAVRSAAA